MALLGSPDLLILDEPINGLDVDGMRIMREILIDLSKKDITVEVSSHILGELEKIATHYGIIKKGKMIKEMTSNEFENECRTYIALKSNNLLETKIKLNQKYSKVVEEDNGYLRIYDEVLPEEVVTYLYDKNIIVSEIYSSKISLEEYYIDLMEQKGGK